MKPSFTPSALSHNAQLVTSGWVPPHPSAPQATRGWHTWQTQRWPLNRRVQHSGLLNKGVRQPVPGESPPPCWAISPTHSRSPNPRQCEASSPRLPPDHEVSGTAAAYASAACFCLGVKHSPYMDQSLVVQPRFWPPKPADGPKISLSCWRGCLNFTPLESLSHNSRTASVYSLLPILLTSFAPCRNNYSVLSLLIISPPCTSRQEAIHYVNTSDRRECTGLINANNFLIP